MSATLVILGATGDLTARLLVPALARLERRGRLGDTKVIGYGLEDWDTDRFADHLAERLAENGDELPDGLRSRLAYHSGELSADDLAPVRDDADGTTVCYLALPPHLFAPAAEALAGAGLAARDATRLVVEKPFGTDGRSAAELDRRIRAHWSESQVFRIDHFLGKETVQNLAMMRFANRALDPLLDGTNIDHVQITVAETLGLEGRYRYYDGIGALRDMIQNHLMQLFCYAAMEPPAVWDPEVIRDHKVELLRAVRTPEGDPGSWAARGQYVAGSIDGEEVGGYRDEPHVPADSATETFAAVRFDVANWRWQGVPFYLRTGKRLGAPVSEIAYRFRRPPVDLFPGAGADAGWLVFRLGTPQGIDLVLRTKVPGLEMEPEMSLLHADYGAGPDEPTAYEQLLLDVLAGDHTPFLRIDEVEEAWRLVDPVLAAWTDGDPEPYPSGSGGPESQVRILENREHQWRPIAGAPAAVGWMA